MDMVEHSVLMLCSYLPGTISDKCIDFVQTYGDEIIDQIVHEEMDPKQVCTALTLCGSQTWGNNVLLRLKNSLYFFVTLTRFNTTLPQPNSPVSLSNPYIYFLYGRVTHLEIS